MSHQSKLQQWLSADRIDITLAKVGIVVCVLLLGMRLLTEQVLLVVIPTAAGAACVLYLGTQNRRSMTFKSPTLSMGVIGYLPSVVFVGLAMLVFLIYQMGGRSAPTLILTGVIGAIILIQILAVDDDELASGLVLLQIVAAAVVIRLSVLFITPGFIGVDIWTHVPDFIEGIVEAESLSAIDDSKYVMAPFYHTIGAIAALVFGSARTGVYLSLGLLLPLSTLLVYATTKLLIPVRWALLAAALYAFADQFIRWGIHIIPTSLGVVFFLGVLYCVTKLFSTNDLWAVGLLVVFSLSIVFTHQVSTAILLVFLGLTTLTIYLSRTLLGKYRRNTGWAATGMIGTFILTLSVTLTSWLNTPWYGDEPFFWQMIDTLEATITGEAGFLNLAGNGGDGGGGGETAVESTGLLTEIIPFIEWFGFAVLLLATVLGGLAMLRMDNPIEITASYLLSGATMFVIVFGLSLFGIRAILPGRWMAFMYAIFAIVGSIGLYYLSRNAPRRVMIAVIIVVAVGYPMTMVVAEKATLDSPAFEDEHPRFSYTESEIAAVGTISSIYTPEYDAAVNSDHPYRTLFRRVGDYNSRTAELDETGPTAPSPIVYRDYQTQGPTSFYIAGDPTYLVDSRTVSPERTCPPFRNHVYASDTVKMCSTAGIDVGGAT